MKIRAKYFTSCICNQDVLYGPEHRSKRAGLPESVARINTRDNKRQNTCKGYTSRLKSLILPVIKPEPPGPKTRILLITPQ